jgi:phosphohistidine phosphatase
MKLIFYTFIKTGILKKLFVIRHAKSDQSFFGNDFERPLNERGKSDAVIMAKRLIETESLIEAFVSSPAKRAKKTAEVFAVTYGKAAGNIIFISALYHATPEVFFETIEALPDNFNTVAIFSHNPGITFFVNSLVKDVKIDNMPTCGIFSVQADTIYWAGFGKAKKEFINFTYPKLTV